MAPSPIRSWQLRVTGIVLSTVAGLAFWAWFNLARVDGAAVFDDPVEHYKYGGLTLKQGFPYYLWVVIPDVFQDLLPVPGGWDVFGFIEEGRGIPVGFAKQTVGFPGLTPNCALCHTGAYRTSPDANRVVVPGAPAAALDFQAFNDFVFAAAADDRFRSDVLMPAIQARFDLSASERLVYRLLLIPTVRRTILKQEREAAWLTSRPPAGRGRFDAFNLFKFTVLGLPDDGSSGTSDYPPLWNHAARSGQFLHWNGSSNQLDEDDHMSVYPLNDGPKGFQPESFARVREFLMGIPTPAYPFSIDGAAAERGALVFEGECASCHESPGVGQVTPQRTVGTDSTFLGMWTEDFVVALKGIDDPPFAFPSLRVTDGFVNVPLDGVWMRAPFLHNGSVPTLRHLLSPAAERPAVFLRGSELYDSVAVGFDWGVATESNGPSNWSVFDTSLRGNSNEGHEYGITLSEEAKRDMIEYLKTR